MSRKRLGDALDPWAPWALGALGVLGGTAILLWHRRRFPNIEAEGWRALISFGGAFAWIAHQEWIPREPQKRESARAGKRRNLIARSVRAFVIGLLAGVTGSTL